MPEAKVINISGDSTNTTNLTFNIIESLATYPDKSVIVLISKGRYQERLYKKMSTFLNNLNTFLTIKIGNNLDKQVQIVKGL